MIRGADLSHADICATSTELEAEENLDPQPPGHVHHHRRGRLRRQLSEAHRHPSPTGLSHQRDWPGRDVGAEQCRGARYGPLAGLALRCCSRSAGPECSGRRNCNVNLDELRGDRPDLDYEPQQAGASLAIFNWTREWLDCVALVCPMRQMPTEVLLPTQAGVGRFVIRATHTRGVGVPSSRSFGDGNS